MYVRDGYFALYLIVAILLSSPLFGCCSSKAKMIKTDTNLTQMQNTPPQEEQSTHSIFFEIPKDSTIEFIAKQSDGFKALYNSGPIYSITDVKEFVELHGYSMRARVHGSYIVLELNKNDTPLIKVLKNSNVTTKGTLPLSVAISEVLSNLNIGYSFDKSLAVPMNKTTHLYYEGNAKEALEHIAQKSGMEVEILENSIYFQQFKTEFVTVDLPLKDRTLATNIINNISSEIKLGSVPDGTFNAVLANTMYGRDIVINYFLSFNNFLSFLTHETKTASIHQPYTLTQMAQLTLSI